LLPQPENGAVQAVAPVPLHHLRALTPPPEESQYQANASGHQQCFDRMLANLSLKGMRQFAQALTSVLIVFRDGVARLST